MAWVRLDDQFHSNPKIVQAGDAAAGFYVRSLSYCAAYSTDGYVSAGWAKQGGRACAKLESVGLWIKVKGGETFTYDTDEGPYTVTIAGPGFFIKDYLLYNATRAHVERMRSELHLKRSEAGKRGAAATWNGKAHGKRYGKPDGNRDGKAAVLP